MSRLHRATLLALLAALLTLAPASAGAAEFGISDFDVSFEAKDGTEELRAGAHPYAMRTSFRVATESDGEGGVRLAEAVRDLIAHQVKGFVGNPTAAPPCSGAAFLTKVSVPGSLGIPACPDSSAVGTVKVLAIAGGAESEEDGLHSAVYNLIPSPGEAARLGFWTSGVPVTISLGVSEEPPYEIVGGPRNVSQLIEVAGSDFTLWGVPADPDHDSLRGFCIDETGESRGACEADIVEKPFLTLPRSCGGPLATSWEARSWEPGSPWISGSALTHDEAGNPRGFGGCAELGFGPSIAAAPTSRAASAPSGLDFSLDVEHNEGLENPSYTARSAADIAKTVVTLPEGMTVNPSQAEGLEVCSEAELGRETASSVPGEGCPDAAKIGTIEVETPLLEEKLLRGALYVAEPYRNPVGSLIALYVVIKSPELGIEVTQALKVEPDPETGQLLTTAQDMPELPFSHFRLRFREGGRSPLITPPGCGEFEVEALLHPSSGAAPVTSTSSFEILTGPDGGPCPSGAPFEPGFEAGSLNNAAGRYSPFLMRLTRGDGEQDLSRFSAVLPPGVAGRIAGIPWCPEAGIAQARGRGGERGGEAELEDPSCPAASAIGRTVAGAGAGSQLTYVPGALYLAGPYGGAPLSVVAITPAVAGPFDAGTVVVRVGLRLNPKTGAVEADGAASDPIPHILQGIPLNVRELRVSADRPAFTLNPTSCAESNTFATLWGAGTALDPGPELPVGRAARFQAAGCAALGFSPKLAIKLRGGVKRGAHPALRAIVTPPPGQANFARAVVTLPRSAFLEQAHIRTICTRVQFAAPPGHGAHCPPGARYGFARAWSPLLDAPAQGPVFLRSSDNNLPDLVVALKGPASAPVDVELSARIDSVKGGIRSTFTGIPDLPVSRFILDMQGGKKGLIVNSRHLCHKPKRNRARSNLTGQNGARHNTRPRVIAVTCQKRRKAKRKRAKKRQLRIARVSQASAVR